MNILKQPFLKSRGHCPTCERDVSFVAHDAWLRDHFLCSNCGSLPRERALMQVIETFFPDWRQAVIHESSPANRGASARLAEECPRYIPSQFFPDQTPGSSHQGIRCENLEQLSFADDSIDLHVTQDVFEHLFHPAQAFAEIKRTLKPGGMHIFTVPLVNKTRPTEIRARIDAGIITHLAPESYHGNPVGNGKSLVTIDWGFDICRHIFKTTGLFTQIIHSDDLGRGIRAEFIEVLVTLKPAMNGHDISIL
ncbi:MAG: class I SAM-dependent methyltransferase [Pseudomonadales bacterium]|nr:class I SAM-dependent methyltransferase [Pseudomonadales bacterium]